ncbi:hypothetical protein ACOZ4I_03095 [Haloarcula salina]|uniref:hypothetical protein n=1 Tax=Haloarcula salina TaxID=1429914 RepID=UPI003C70492B
MTEPNSLEPRENSEPASLFEMAEAIEESNEQDLSFWKTQNKRSVEAFQSSVSMIDEKKNTVLGLIKINLLISTFVLAVFQYVTNSGMTMPRYSIISSFTFLLLSMTIFVIIYFILDNRFIGATSNEFLEVISSGYNEKQYYKVITPIYLKRVDKNIQISKKASYGITIGISFIFASLGSVASLYLFV